MGVVVREKVKGSGEWWVFIRHNGKRKSKKIGNDKDLAIDVAEKINARLVLKEFDLDTEPEQEAPLFERYAELWVEGYIKPLRRTTTYERYKSVLAMYVNPTLGKIPIDQIRRGDVRNLFLGHYKRGLSKSTIGLIRNVISGVIGHAVDEELIPVNPVTGITRKLQLERDRKINIEPLTQDEVNLFLNTCLKHYPEHYPMFLCAFRTGMRLGELLALKWDDIDWHGKYIKVDRSFRHGRMTGTKTGKARRVDMSDQLMDGLKSLYKTRKEEALRFGKGEIIEIVFHRKGLPLSQNSARGLFKRILPKAGLRNMRFHDIRHTFASLLLSNGQSPVYVKDQLGHSSIQITVDIYGHLIPSSNREAVNQLDEAAPCGTPMAPCQKVKDVTSEDHALNSNVVAMQGFEPRTLRI